MVDNRRCTTGDHLSPVQNLIPQITKRVQLAVRLVQGNQQKGLTENEVFPNPTDQIIIYPK